ncbi:MAG: tRNA lysidine(34) synthetase TilS [Gammaproteobacteria bacterium]|nr:tRNA lysidine(34) synthetase TilS [Gammaproteobacteria bacterium]
MALTPELILSQVAAQVELQGPRRYIVAFSGGLDSTVLLDLTRRALPRIPGADLLAVHVDHGLHADSAQWASRCADVARRFGVAFALQREQVSYEPGDSPEARARSVRYAALLKHCRPGDVLLTAHHRDDQLETVLLQLLRGAGSAGLAGMPVLRQLQAGAWHFRPLLDTAREQLHTYAGAHGLEWSDDPSNVDQRYDRNYLRHVVLPLVRDRWPGAAVAVSRAARHSAAMARLAHQVGAQDALAAAAGDTFDCSRVGTLSGERVANALRQWLVATGLPTPDTAQFTQVMRLIDSQPGEACVSWPGCEVRRYGTRLYAMQPLAALTDGFTATLSAGASVTLPAGLGRLVYAEDEAGLAAGECETLSVRFRRGGESIRPKGGGQTRKLRNLYQEARVVPWMRPRIPLLYAGDQLAAVADLWQEEALSSAGRGLRLRWEDHPALY